MNHIKYGMIVAKFGGTCVTPKNLKRIKQIVSKDYKVVVVSAIGKTFDDDTKVTDLLIKLHSMLPDTSLFEVVAKKYRQLVFQNAIDIDIDGLLNQTLCDIVSKNSFDNTISKGEELSAKITAKFLNLPYVEIERLITFVEGKMHLKRSVQNIKNAFKGVEQCVVAGFYGSDCTSFNRKVFSRGGSDITGAIVANAVDASIYENWTDVDGFYVANPRSVSNVGVVKCISYDEMKLLAKCGGKVLHFQSVYPTQKKGIPIHIRNIFNPTSAGTLVNIQKGKGQVLGVFENAISPQHFEQKIVFSCGINKILNWVSSCFLCNENLVSIFSQQNVLTTISTKSMLKSLVKSIPEDI